MAPAAASAPTAIARSIPIWRASGPKAYVGSLGMREGGAIVEILPPVNHALKGSSAWMRLAREKAGARG